MNREEFLRQFRNALEGKVPERTIAENVEYYRNYINAQVSAGQSETDVLRGLGDPRLLAKTIEETNLFSKEKRFQDFDSETRGGWYSGYNAGRQDGHGSVIDDEPRPRRKITVIPAWLAGIAVILAVMFFLYIAFCVLASLLPVLLVIFAAALVYRLVRGMFR